MKTILIIIAISMGGLTYVHAQNHPITSADELQQLVVQPDMVKLKLLIFDDTYVYADRFIYFALLQGLAKDQVPLGIAKNVADESQGPNFVDKCEICNATQKGFSDYALYGMAYSTKSNLYKDLGSKKDGKRHEAIKQLTDSYTTALLTQLQLSTAEQQMLQNKLAGMRKKGMSGMNDKFGSKFCPSCDGATHTND